MQDVAIAILYARGQDHLDSVKELRKVSASLHESGASLLMPSNDFVTGVYVKAPETPASPLLSFGHSYPNPFASTTTLRYAVPKTMRVRLSVHDLLGREVALLVDATKDAGEYEALFDAGNLPAGLYLARIQFDHLSFTQHMLLVR